LTWIIDREGVHADAPDPSYGPYKIIYADPPWHYNNRHDSRGKSKFGQGVALRYSGGVTRFEDLAALPIEQLAAKDAYLFCWVVPPSIEDCLAVMRAWGFKIATKAFCWTKTYPDGRPFKGVGAYTASNSEDCYLGVRGDRWVSERLVDQDVRTVHPRYTDAPHSHKPLEVRERIERMCGDVPRIELFARTCGVGWDAVGDELEGSVGPRSYRGKLQDVLHDDPLTHPLQAVQSLLA
jgi:N6-adenosine-specific RNA methylase IME4